MSAETIPDEAAYYAAMTNCLDRYEPMARAAGRQDVLAFIGQFRDAIVGRAPVYKLNRWLGYIQGVLIEIGCTNVLAEREWSRPLFRPLDYPSDRATRPAEPAAPVAEAVDGEVVGWFCIDLIAGGVKGFTFSESLAKQRDGYRYLGQLAWEVYPVVRLSTLEAERARADRLERERDWQYEENVARIAAQGAAEQRAADALARAEKAEGALAEAQGALVDLADWLESDCGAELPHSHIEKQVAIARSASPRASREAQAATDGGDNG